MRMVFALVACTCACGRVGFDATGDGGRVDDAADDAPGDGFPRSLDGYWVITEAMIRTETQPRTRADLIAGIRGDAQFAGTSYLQRHLLLAGGVGAGPPSAGPVQLTIDGDAWIVTDGTDTSVYEVTWTGADTLESQLVPGDPRNTGDPPDFERVVLQRTAPPPPGLVGAWDVSRLLYQGIPEFATGTCAPNGAGSLFMTATIDIASTFMFAVSFDQEFFSDPACTNTSATSLDTGVGYFEATGSDFSLWIDLASSPPVMFAGVILPSLSGLGVRLERTACSGAPECTGLPLMLELEPR